MKHDRNPETGLPVGAKPRRRTQDEAVHGQAMQLYHAARRNPIIAAAVVRAAAAILAEDALTTGNTNADVAVNVIREEVAENIAMNLDKLRVLLRVQYEAGRA